MRSSNSDVTRTPQILKSPISGVIVPLEKVPDPIFAQKLVGVGVAIDPTGQEIVAPCDGRISQLHPAHHAIAITAKNGTEILIHIGLDTVKLRGQGFTPMVKLGKDVREGDVLIRFDADSIAQQAKSLITEIVLTNPDLIEGLQILPESAGEGVMTQAGAPLLRYTLRDVQPTPEIMPTAMATVAKSEPVRIRNHMGLHARPAAVLSNLAKQFESDLLIRKGHRTANLRSVVAIMGLEIGTGDAVVIEAIGPDARAAIVAMVKEIEKGFGEAEPPSPKPPVKTASSAPTASGPSSGKALPGRFTGVTASPGFTVGKIFQLKTQEILVEEMGGTPAHETERLSLALREAKIQLETLIGKLQKSADPSKAQIFAAHQELLDDPSLLEITQKEIAKRKSAAFAWKVAFTETSSRLAGLNNQLLAARANDVRDVGQRVLHLLQGEPPAAMTYPDQCILVAEDLTPSDVATLDRAKVLGFITTTGGSTSHVAILARSLDLPAIAGVDPRVLDIPNDTQVLLDATQGVLSLNPSETDLMTLGTKRVIQEKRKREERATTLEPALTLDGRRIEIVANIKSENEAEGAVEMGAEGVGLLRTEFLFMGRDYAPTENEQYEAYRAIARHFGPPLEKKLGRKPPLIIRTLDVGGDKPLRYLPIPKEDNPFLGERGLRVSLNRPEMFREQLRAILRVSSEADVRIMFPMVSTLDEVRQAKALLEEERKKLGVAPIQTGIMVEVPSVALMADKFAQESDFFSIGSNDLAQYTLAIDRGHPKLAAQVDGLDPSILHLIDMSVRAAHAHGKWVGVCGGIASDTQAVPILLGLGVDELSVSVPAIPSIKAQIRRLNLKDCEKLAQRALQASSGAEIRSWIPTDESGESFKD
jgi:multiphosphoryl transfer protein